MILNRESASETVSYYPAYTSHPSHPIHQTYHMQKSSDNISFNFPTPQDRNIILNLCSNASGRIELTHLIQQLYDNFVLCRTQAQKLLAYVNSSAASALDDEDKSILFDSKLQILEHKQKYLLQTAKNWASILGEKISKQSELESILSTVCGNGEENLKRWKSKYEDLTQLRVKLIEM